MKNFSLLLAVLVIVGCGGTEEESHGQKIDRMANEWLEKQTAFDNTDPYDIIMTTFVGNPIKSQVQPMMEQVMHEYKFSIDRDNIIRVANLLLELRKQSKLGVTEMDILKHIYQKGNRRIGLPEQAAISSSFLEKSK